MAPERAPAFQFYPGDFLTDGNAAAMTLMERGAYITLLCYCWTEQSLPCAPDRLARLIGSTPAVFLKLWPALEPCFRIDPDDPGRLIHPRLDKERQKQEQYRARQVEAGRASGRTRRQPEGNRKATTVEPNANQVATETPTKTNSSIFCLRTSVEEKKESVHTRETPKVSAPNTGSGVFAGSLPRDHLRHAVCGRVCLHESQFVKFARKFGGEEEAARAQVRLWARSVLEEWNQGVKGTTAIQGNDFAWWDVRWDEWQGRPTAATGTLGKQTTRLAAAIANIRASEGES